MRSALGLACAVACATTGGLGCGAVDADAVRADLDRRDLTAARSKLDAALGATASSDEPAGQGSFYGMSLLERSTVRAAQGDAAGAARDLARADKILDVQDMIRNTEVRALRVPSEARYAYLRGWEQALNVPPGLKVYERLLVNPLAALARLASGDTPGACVEGRRFEVMATYADRIAAGRATDVRSFGERVAALACARPAAAPARALVVVEYGRVSHPDRTDPSNTTSPVVIAGGAETAVDGELEVRVDGGEPIALAEALDVDRAAHADYEEATHASDRPPALRGFWSPWAWQVLPAHIALGAVDLPSGAHAAEVRVRGTVVHRDFVVGVGGGATTVVVVVAPW